MAWFRKEYDSETLEGKLEQLDKKARAVARRDVTPQGRLTDTDDYLKAIGDLGHIANAQQEIKRELSETYPEEWVIVGYDHSGNPIYDRKSVWFTEKTLGRDYALGGLTSRLLPLPAGAMRAMTMLEREVGAQVYGEVAGYEKKTKGIIERAPSFIKPIEKILHTNWMRNIAALHRTGLVQGLAHFQAEHGLLLVSAIIADEKDPVAAIQQLEGCYEAAGSNPELQQQLLDFVAYQELESYYEKITQNHRTQNGAIAVPQTRRLLPRITSTIPAIVPEWDYSAGPNKWFVDGFASLTENRCELYILQRNSIK